MNAESAISVETHTNCDHERVENITRAGRHMAFRNIDGLPIPAEVALPTCTACGTWFLNRESALTLEAAMTPVYVRELAGKAKTALAELAEQDIKQRDIEPLLGLSAGYLSKVRNDRTEPSGLLTAALMLLAVHPQMRTGELKGLWPAGAQSSLRDDRLKAIGKTLQIRNAVASTQGVRLPAELFIPEAQTAKNDSSANPSVPTHASPKQERVA